MLEKTLEITQLFDFYGKLLTDRQQESIRLYYFHDLSLSEIADKIGISRQGVYDHLDRGEKLLYSYEEKLGLVNRYKTVLEDLKDFNKFIKNNVSIQQTEKENLLNRLAEITKQL